MANVCSNDFYAYSDNHDNIKYITTFLQEV